MSKHSITHYTAHRGGGTQNEREPIVEVRVEDGQFEVIFTKVGPGIWIPAIHHLEPSREVQLLLIASPIKPQEGTILGFRGLWYTQRRNFVSIEPSRKTCYLLQEDGNRLMKLNLSPVGVVTGIGEIFLDRLIVGQRRIGEEEVYGYPGVKWPTLKEATK